MCDDDKEIVDAIEIYLMQEGYQVYKAYDGEQAIKLLKEKIGVNFTFSPSTVTSFVSSLMQSPPARNNALFSTKAYDGEQAIKLLKEKEVHLLIIDVMMPKLDGRVIFHIQVPKGSISAQIRFYPCHQFQRIKRFCHIVVSTNIKAENLVGILYLFSHRASGGKRGNLGAFLCLA